MLINSNKIMTFKTFKIIKLVAVVFLAALASVAINTGNYIWPVAAFAVVALLLLYGRSRVKEVMADERDYALAGRAALWSMQIFSWLSVIFIFILYSQKAVNPAYEAVASTLAYAVCFLMLLYAILFRYYEKFALLQRKKIYLALVIFLVVLLIIAGLRFLSGEDNWLCQDGSWVKHGQPDWPAPTAECR